MAMLAAGSPPSPTPAPALASTYGAVLAPRTTTNLFGDSCYNVEGLLSCANILSGCYGDILKATNYNAAATSCFCASGMPYLNCYFNALSTANCYESIVGTLDWNSYMVDYFLSTCGSVPGTAMGQMKPPATVSLSFQTVKVVTFTGSQPPPSAAPINFKGSGELLVGECTTTDFTLVDAGSTVYFAGFHGCNGDRPQCCPWSVATTTEPPPVTGGTNADLANRIGFDFPQPADKNQAVLANCADDYYSISGGCCPVGYWLFTTDVGGQTPCYSSINRVATPPTLTAGLAGNPTDTSKPTSAVVNIIWSMRYPVADPSGGLSTAAKAGIGAGAGVAAILIATLAICLWRSRRKNKKLEAEKATNGRQTLPPQPVMQQAGIPNGQFSQYPPGTLAPAMADASARGSIMTNTTSVSAPSPLVRQSTGTSNGGTSELSAQSDYGLLHNGSYHANSPSPATPSMGYPAPIAEADESQGQAPQQQPGYGYPPQGYFSQQPLQQFQSQPGQPQFYPVPGQPYPQFYPAPGPQMAPQGQQPHYAMPPQQPQFYPLQGQHMTSPPGQQPHYGAAPQQMNIPEMSARREIDPPHEVAGSQVR